MTPFALRLCFFDPERDAPDYGGERSTFVVRAETMSEALVRWLDRAEARDVELHLVEQAGVVGGGDLGDLVEASQAGGIAAGQSYAYTPLAEAQGVYFGLVETTEDVAEVAVKGENASAALRRLIAEAGGGAWEIRAIDGFCDLSQAEESATFNGTPLKLAALGVSMGEGFQIGARYALEGG